MRGERHSRRSIATSEMSLGAWESSSWCLVTLNQICMLGRNPSAHACHFKFTSSTIKYKVSSTTHSFFQSFGCEADPFERHDDGYLALKDVGASAVDSVTSLLVSKLKNSIWMRALGRGDRQVLYSNSLIKIKLN